MIAQDAEMDNFTKNNGHLSIGNPTTASGAVGSRVLRLERRARRSLAPSDTVYVYSPSAASGELDNERERGHHKNKGKRSNREIRSS